MNFTSERRQTDSNRYPKSSEFILLLPIQEGIKTRVLKAKQTSLHWFQKQNIRLIMLQAGYIELLIKV